MSETWREIVAEWQGEDSFIGRDKRGISIQLGECNEQPGASPMELVLIALAGCTGMDITSILRKQRQKLHSFQIRVKGKRADTYPMVWTDIHVEYLLSGDGLDPQAVERAIELSEDKYCSVGIMLRKVANVQTSYRILSSKIEAGQELSM